MALALYRKYRPRTFAEVIGQDHVTEPLSQALRSGRLNHAYLFSGPRGCGKTSSARILARSLNCEQGPTPEPCGVCDSCKSLAADGAGSIDVIEIDAASHGGVDDARELRERAFFAPASSRFKIYVIDEAHMVSTQGFNALLKLVEEPPEYVKFIFATTEPEKVLGTIKSRTHHYPFRLIPPGVLRPYLEQLASAEGVKIEPSVFPLVVRAGGGSARDSLSVLDQLIAGAGPEGVSYARAVALLGVTDAALIDEMCDALAAGDGAAAYATIDRVAEAGHDPRRFASDLLERLRDLIVLRQVPDAVAKGLIDGPADQIERMAAQAERLGPATLSRCADIVHNGLVEMRGTTAPRLLLELICARMLLPGAEDSTGSLLQRLERMERRLTLSGDATPAAAPIRPAAVDPGPPAATTSAPSAPASAAPVAPPQGVRESTAPRPGHAPAAPGPGPASAAPVVEPPTAVQPPARRPVPPEAVMPDPATPDPMPTGAGPTGELDAAAVRRVWGEVVGMVNRSNKRIAALMRDAVVRDLDGDTLVLTVKSPVLAQMLANASGVLTDALYEELGGRWQIRCEVAGEQRAPASATPPRQPTGPANSGPVSNGPVNSGPVNSGPATDGPATDGPSGGASPRGGVNGSAPSGGGRGATGGRERSTGSGGGGGAGRAGSGSSGAGGGSSSAGGGSPSSADDDDWPEPARPGGAASSGSAPGGAADDDWPEPTPPGGTAPASTTPAASPLGGGTHATAVAGDRNSTGPNGSGAQKASGTSTSGGAGGAAVSAGLAAARAAAAGRGPKPAPAAERTADSDWAGEPPYDPDYDGPRAQTGNGHDGPRASTGIGHDGPRASTGIGYEGFDPGDEPLDEVIDERTARQTSEQQAVQLLQQTLGAERIGEVDLK
ncbi:DNA polymerase III subunit gamma and tau [Micromonospora sp. WMMD1102]|uniref:DNA polymerase III subunit gamma and tau n=1 Tax=Micromonospora sp. WMMD1102 TaxID=3016105 RepID=UPI0024155AC9|nr:DNA polymerase III subunit gamma and tau [Micromonospora sp. WMMD1102]MDG4791232.1 DNA polymerase III subunit gamma and tau [Micromonospora sp. WMMD1102]